MNGSASVSLYRAAAGLVDALNRAPDWAMPRSTDRELDAALDAAERELGRYRGASKEERCFEADVIADGVTELILLPRKPPEDRKDFQTILLALNAACWQYEETHGSDPH